MKSLYRNLFFLFVCSFAFNAFSQADESNQDQGVKRNGVVFNISPDRRIEKVGGIYEPEGLDKYVDRRMREISERIDSLDAQIKSTNAKLDQILTELAKQSSSSPPNS